MLRARATPSRTRPDARLRRLSVRVPVFRTPGGGTGRRADRRACPPPPRAARATCMATWAPRGDRARTCAHIWPLCDNRISELIADTVWHTLCDIVSVINPRLQRVDCRKVNSKLCVTSTYGGAYTVTRRALASRLDSLPWPHVRRGAPPPRLCRTRVPAATPQHPPPRSLRATVATAARVLASRQRGRSARLAPSSARARGGVRGTVPAPASSAMPPRRTRRHTHAVSTRRRAGHAVKRLWSCAAASTNVSAARGLRRRRACLHKRTALET